MTDAHGAVGDARKRITEAHDPIGGTLSAPVSDSSPGMAPRATETLRGPQIGAMTPERLSELAALCENATPGPWQVGEMGHFYEGNTHIYYADVEPSVAAGVDPGDAAFIAAARSAVPELLAEVARLTEERDAYRKAKQENDERFQLEALAARETVARVTALRDKWQREIDAIAITHQDPTRRELAIGQARHMKTALTEALGVSGE